MKQKQKKKQRTSSRSFFFFCWENGDFLFVPSSRCEDFVDGLYKKKTKERRWRRQNLRLVASLLLFFEDNVGNGLKRRGVAGTFIYCEDREKKKQQILVFNLFWFSPTLPRSLCVFPEHFRAFGCRDRILLFQHLRTLCEYIFSLFLFTNCLPCTWNEEKDGAVLLDIRYPLSCAPRCWCWRAILKCNAMFLMRFKKEINSNWMFEILRLECVLFLHDPANVQQICISEPWAEPIGSERKLAS